jgi:hypothetical protein
LGEIISKDKRWNAVFFNDHIKFYNCDDEDWHCYYDMNEIDKRYIDLRIDQWLDDQG